VGPYVWHEYDVARTVGELRAIKSAGHRTVRTHLLWDAFMPTPARVEPSRLRDFDRFLAAASDLSLQVIPVMFVQTLGRCVMLPAYAIDVDAKRRGLRVVADAVPQPGGPRYVYTDPLMLETSVRWVDSMLGEFAGHPAIAMWDIGHDPAGGVRPQRIDDMRTWVALIAGRIHEREQRCMASLSANDAVTARAVRPAIVGGLVDVLGLDLAGAALEQVGGVTDPAAAAFLLQLMQSLAGDVPLYVHLGAHRSERERSDDDRDDAKETDASSRRFADAAVDALTDLGASGVMAAMWSNPGPRAVTTPPYDKDDDMRGLGVIDASGAATAFGSAWLEQARRERERADSSPWPQHLNVDDYYANLPDSLHELRAAWERGSSEHPAMLR
jgi:hypothetical protein